MISLMYKYNSLDHHFNEKRINEYSREDKRLTKHSRDILHRRRGITLIKSTKIRCSQDDQTGRLVLVIWSQESQNYSKRVIRLGSTKIKWFLWWPSMRLDQFPGDSSRAVFSQAKAKGDYQAVVHLHQMVLMIVRQEAGPVAWWPKMLK
jgi:hypothetical protein